MMKIEAQSWEALTEGEQNRYLSRAETNIREVGEAVDKGIHIGGAFSATIPLTALFYGGVIELDIENPEKAERIII